MPESTLSREPDERPPDEKYGARFVVRGGRCQSMEGSTHPRERGHASSPDYGHGTGLIIQGSRGVIQAAKALRNAYADANFLIVEGVESVGG